MNSRLLTKEKSDAVLLYAKFENAAQVRRQWKSNHTSQPPTNATILSLYNKFKETGSVHDLERSGPPPSVVTEEKAEEVRNLLAATPYTSIRRGAAQIGISKSSYNRILNKLDFHKYRPYKCVELSDDDYDRRVEFCEAFSDMIDENPDLPDHIIWSIM